ncbi:MAG: siderophore-interacting protein [Acidimicrobiales bacterium]
MSFTPQPSTADLAQRLGASAHCCEVVASSDLTPTLREVVLRGNARTLAGEPGQDVMVRVEDPAGRFVRRRFSVRSLDAVADTFSLWVTVDHDGPGVTWARTAILGDHVDVIGPRGKIPLAAASRHLFFGDVSALAVSYRMAQSIAAPGAATIAIEVDHVDEFVTAPAPEGVEFTGVIVERRGRGHDDPTGLLDALATVAIPSADVHAYVLGEFHVVKAVRAALADRGLDETQVSHKAYWRADRGNAEHGEPDRDE